MKVPSDLGKFFNISGGNIYYGYIFDKKLILDVISKDLKVTRYKLPNTRGIFYLIDNKCILVILVSLIGENKKNEEDENEFIGILELNN